MSLVPFNYIGENSEATPGLFNSPLSALSASIAGVAANQGSGLTMSVLSDVSTGGGIFTAAPSNLSGAVTIHANSNVTDYLAFTDSAAARSSYLVGSHAGGTADGLNIFDSSGNTMIVSFSKQSVRFYQNVVGPVFDTGGALASTYNAATFGGSTKTVQIQAAILQASLDNVARVYVPANMYPYDASTVSFINTVQMVREGGNWAVYDVLAYGANGDDSTSNTSAFQAWINAITKSQGVGYIPPGIFRCGQILDTTSNRISMFGASGATIRSTDSIWLRIRPAASGKVGVTLRDLTFGQPVSNNTFGSPMILLHGDSTVAGIIEVDINNIVFRMNNAAADGIHLRAVFDGRVGNIFAYPSALSTRLILYTAEDFNSGNIHFDTIEAQCPVALQLNRSFNNVGGSTQLLNTILVSNMKCVQSPGQHSMKYVTLTSKSFCSTSTLSLSAADVTSISTGDWVVCADAYYSGDVIRVNSKLSTTMVQLAENLRSDLTSGTTLAAGNFGAVLLGNARGVQFNSPHIESIGYGIVVSNADQVQINNPMLGSNVRRGVVCKDGATQVNVAYPLYSKSETTKVLMEVFNEGIANVNNFNNTIWAPAGFGSGTGPLSFLSDANGDSAGNVYNQFPQTSVLATIGSSSAPPIAFKSEQSLGFYQSGASAIGLSYGQLQFPAGAATRPAWAFSSESSLGIYRSANSTIAQSYGTFVAPQMAVTSGGAYYLGNFAGVIRLQVNGAGLGVNGANNGAGTLSVGSLQVNAGAAIGPTLHFGGSESSLGLYRSGVSTIALSYGTLNLATQAVRLSMRTLAASSVTASAAKTNVAVDEVVFTIGGASGASLIIYSGGTAYGFNSAFSAAAS